jgi:hypothetical protein
MASERLVELLVGGGVLVVDDGAVDISDGLYIHTRDLFANGPEIPPYPEYRVDPTLDELGCLEYAPCGQKQ